MSIRSMRELVALCLSVSLAVAVSGQTPPARQRPAGAEAGQAATAAATDDAAVAA